MQMKSESYVYEASTALLEPEELTPAPEKPGVTAGDSRVDLEAGIIRGVKVIGRRSNNPPRLLGADSDAKFYTYTMEALKNAIPQYEGINVFVDHLEGNFDRDGRRLPSRANRKLKDKFGKLRNVRVTESGMFADLHYLKSHDLAAMVAEAAMRMPDLVGLSHYAITTFEVADDGAVFVVDIPRAESVDIIGERPGTTTGLFESLHKGSYEEMELNNQEKTGAGAGTGTATEEAVTPAAVGAPPVGETPTPETPAEKPAGLRAMLMELLETEMSDEELLNSLTEMVAAAVTSEADESDEEKPAETPAPAASETPADEEKTGTASESLAQLKRLNAAALLMGKHNVIVTESRQTALASLATDEQRLELIKDFKNSGDPAKTPAPRSKPPAVYTQESLHNSQQPEKKIDRKAELDRLAKEIQRG